MARKTKSKKIKKEIPETPLKKISRKAKELRAENKRLTQQSAIKQASALYRKGEL